jgi:hypothetical protein
VQSSIDDLGDSRFGVMAQQHGLAAPLLGSDKPMGLGNEAGVFASFGSASGGGFVRYGFGSGFSLLGGLAFAKETYPDADLRHSGIGALALQYIYGRSGWWHPFGWRLDCTRHLALLHAHVHERRRNGDRDRLHAWRPVKRPGYTRACGFRMAARSRDLVLGPRNLVAPSVIPPARGYWLLQGAVATRD